jgi:hypothetical protein
LITAPQLVKLVPLRVAAEGRKEEEVKLLLCIALSYCASLRVVMQIQKDFGKEAVVKRFLLVAIALYLDKDHRQINRFRRWVQNTVNTEGKQLDFLGTKV